LNLEVNALTALTPIHSTQTSWCYVYTSWLCKLTLYLQTSWLCKLTLYLQTSWLCKLTLYLQTSWLCQLTDLMWTHLCHIQIGQQYSGHMTPAFLSEGKALSCNVSLRTWRPECSQGSISAIRCLYVRDRSTWNRYHYGWAPPSVCLPSVYLTSPHMTSSPRSSPSVFMYCEQSKAGGGNGRGTRLELHGSVN